MFNTFYFRIIRQLPVDDRQTKLKIVPPTFEIILNHDNHESAEPYVKDGFVYGRRLQIPEPLMYLLQAFWGLQGWRCNHMFEPGFHRYMKAACYQDIKELLFKALAKIDAAEEDLRNSVKGIENV